MNRISTSGINRRKERKGGVGAIIRREMIFKQHYENIKKEASSELTATKDTNNVALHFFDTAPKAIGIWGSAICVFTNFCLSEIF